MAALHYCNWQPALGHGNTLCATIFLVTESLFLLDNSESGSTPARWSLISNETTLQAMVQVRSLVNSRPICSRKVDAFWLAFAGEIFT